VNTPEHVHFVGIGGYGMSAIARVMLDMGYKVSGSDVAQKELTDQLSERGATVYIGHEANNVNGADLVVYSTGVPEDNVELKAAEDKRIPLLHRSQMLARLLNERKGIAVSGAHGKTTTSSMIAQVMEECGVDPTYVIGGEVVGLGGNAKAGNSEYVVAEADESDGSFLEYFPYLAVVTNVEADHLENYDGSFDNLKEAYKQFLSQVRPGGAAVVCGDDPYIQELLPGMRSEVVTYGLERDRDFAATDIQNANGRTVFTVWEKGGRQGNVTLSFPGRHNVYNALATIAVCRHIGLPFQDIAKALPHFSGTKRRFQLVGEVDGITVIDDYAHHPTEIETTIEAANALNKRIIAVFQPQRYSRTYFLLDAFSRAFGRADEVVMTDIYSPVGEARIEGVSSERLTQLIRENSNPNVIFCKTNEDVHHYLMERVKPGDLVLTMGAGDIWTVAHKLVQTLHARSLNQP
jgi:UDP-N-acetylmuramate--alanine ligase